MEGAVRNNVPGIDGDCGGACACATCHVYVDPGWIAKTDTAENETENSMLDMAEDVRENSRLGGQISASDELDGLIVRMRMEQH